MPISTMVAKRLKSVIFVYECGSFPLKLREEIMVIDHLRRGMMNPPNKYMPTKTREPTVEAVTREGKAEANDGIYLIQMSSLTTTTFEISGFQMPQLTTAAFEFL